MVVRLIVDDRERAVMQYLPRTEAIAVSIERIEVGDYNIICDDKIVACIERKSLTDYAQSIRDGRMQNKLKMVDLRAKTHTAQLIYIVEGPLAPSPESEFARVPYSRIYASILHLFTEHNISTMRTRSELETGRLLADLCMSYAARPPKSFIVWEDEKNAVSDPRESRDIEGASETSHESFLHIRAEISLFDRIVNAWKNVSGVGVKIGTRLASDGRVFDVMNRWQNGDGLSGFPDRTREVVRKLCSNQWNHTQNQLLTGIHGCGPKMAAECRLVFSSLPHLIGVLRAFNQLSVIELDAQKKSQFLRWKKVLNEGRLKALDVLCARQ